MSEIPAGVAIETVYVVEAHYSPQAAERRPAVRPEHLSRIAAMQDEGILLEAGGYLDLSTALLLFRVPDEGTARSIVEQDVYFKAGVWDGYSVRPFGRVARAGSKS